MVAPRALIILGACATIIAACSSESERATAGAGTIDAGPGDDAADAPTPPRALLPYPPGPYGPAVGDVMADFHVQGYALSRTERDSTKLPFRDVSLAEVRSDPECTCLVVLWNATGFSCGPCFDAGAAVAAAVANDRSICGIGVVAFSYDNFVDGKEVSVPTRADLDDFAQAVKPAMPVGLHTPSALASLSAWSVPAIPDFWIVRPSDMRIVGFSAGLGSGSLAATAKERCASPSSPVETMATGLDPHAMVLGADHVWLTDATRGLARIPRAGGGALETVATNPGAVADRLVVDGIYAYWSTEGAPSTIRRVPIAGGLVEEVTTTTAAVSSLATSNGDLLVATTDGAIRAYPGARTIATGEAGPTSLVAAGTNLLWVDRDTGEVVKSNLDGTSRTVIGEPLEMPASAKPAQVFYRAGDVFILGHVEGKGSVVATTTIDGGFALEIMHGFSIPTIAFEPDGQVFWYTNRPGPGFETRDALGRIRAERREDTLNGTIDLIVGQPNVDAMAIDTDGTIYFTTRPREGEPAIGTLRRRRP